MAVDREFCRVAAVVPRAEEGVVDGLVEESPFFAAAPLGIDLYSAIDRVDVEFDAGVERLAEDGRNVDHGKVAVPELGVGEIDEKGARPALLGRVLTQNQGARFATIDADGLGLGIFRCEVQAAGDGFFLKDDKAVVLTGQGKGDPDALVALTGLLKLQDQIIGSERPVRRGQREVDGGFAAAQR